MKNIKRLLFIALISLGSIAQAAPQLCQGMDHQSGKIFRLKVEEMGLPEGTRIHVTKLDNRQQVKGLYQVSGYLEAGLGIYVNLKFISGDAEHFYQLLLSGQKTFLITEKDFSQLFCE